MGGKSKWHQAKDLGQAGWCAVLEVRAGCSGMMETSWKKVLASNGASSVKRDGNHHPVHRK